MAITFTKEQQKVIDLHHRNILVSAAAGSGKTAVLVERIIQMICNEEDPIDIDRLLIVTFTNAAAAEMRERISLGIARELALHPQSEHLQRQSAILHNAQITTVDSFCLFLIRNHFNVIGLDPNFRVADEGEIKLLRQDVLQQLLEDKFEAGEEKFLHCVEYFCPNGKEIVLEQHIVNLYQYAQSNPWPLKWLEARQEDYSYVEPEQIQDTDYGRYLLYHIQAMLKGCLESFIQVQSLCQEPDGPYMYGELVDKELEQLERLCQLTGLEELASRLGSVTFGRLPAKKDDTVSPVKRELAKKIRAGVKSTLQDLAQRFFTTSLNLAAWQSAQCEEPVKMLIALTIEFTQRLTEVKQERKLLDFSDMEHYALDILLEQEQGVVRPSSVAREYRQHFTEILIDEYQDSNLVQEFLLRAVSGEEEEAYNRFMVGDVKQSIYKFRLARPELFLEKYNTYTLTDGDCQRIDLSRNFRSRSQVVDTVNGVFSRIMSKQLGGIEYDEKAALYAGASYPDNPDCRSEFLLIEKPESDDTLTAKQAEALAIAERIRSLKKCFLVTDKESGQLRPSRYSDMVILLRTNSGWDEEFKQVLEAEGIPVYITSKTGYFAATEVQELLALLRVLDNPMQDIALFGVMKSLFGGFTEEEIAALKGPFPEISLFEVLEIWAMALTQDSMETKLQRQNLPEEIELPAMEAVSESESVSESEGKEEVARRCRELVLTLDRPELCQKVVAFLDKINQYRSWTVYLPIRELLEKIVEENHYLAYVSALPAGSKRKANVEMLFTKASDFEKTSYFGLFHFIRYMDQLEKYDVDYGEAELLDENADVVRIMSIHKSKGLEFPITFVSGLSKRFNMQDANQSLIIDMDLGIGTDYVNPKKRIRNKTLRRSVLARKLREDNLAEELRVLYVAMTRPKEKLIMTAFLENAAEKWEIQQQAGVRNLTFHDFMEAGSYLDFLLPVIGEAAVDVTLIGREDLSAEGIKEQVRLSERRERLRKAAAYVDMDALEELKQRFAYEYPWQALEALYTKTTVSELKIAAMAEKDEAAYHAFEEQEIIPYIPAFRREQEEVSGSLRGNAFHKVMELIDFCCIYQGILEEMPFTPEAFIKQLSSQEKQTLLHAQIQELLAQKVVQGYLSEEYCKAVSIPKLSRFLSDPIAYRMWRAQKAGQLYREQPFVYGVSANRLGEQFPDTEKVLIQGIIDVFFVEEDGLVLLDYKTDKVRFAKELWNRYETQLSYYEEALCRLMQLPMKEKILYSFSLEKCVVGDKKVLV